MAPYSLVAGNPARLIRARFAPDTVATLLRLGWWDWPVDRIKAAVPALLSGDLAALAALAPEGPAQSRDGIP